MKRIGILLTNTGTPDEPTPQAVRRYLKEFLSDKRIVQLPRLIWLPILYGFILTLRPRWSAKLYQKIWTDDGSPLRVTMQKLPICLQHALEKENGAQYAIEIGMNYGNPSIHQALENLRREAVDKIVVLPLYPQYSYVTTASSFDRVKMGMKNWETMPTICSIEDYADNPDYIRAVALSIQSKWTSQGEAEHLLISFHGIPERFIAKGDPYKIRCERTAHLIAQEMKLSEDKWTLCFQSRFGYAKWLKPSTQLLLAELPQRGIKQMDVVCPGFPIDCLETLEEIALRGEETFFAAGGTSLRYIPALNDSNLHIELLAKMIVSVLS